jgi:hypothetical protein
MGPPWDGPSGRQDCPLGWPVQHGPKSLKYVETWALLGDNSASSETEEGTEWDPFAQASGHSGVTELKNTSSTYHKNHDQPRMALNQVFDRTVH